MMHLLYTDLFWQVHVYIQNSQRSPTNLSTTKLLVSVSKKKNSYSCAFLGSYTRLININTCIKCISCSIRLKIKVNVSTFFFIQTLVYSSICDRDYHDQPRPHAFPNNDIQQMHICTMSKIFRKLQV